ncbi:hypothetical protein [Halorubrum lipolyticum]|uniref:CopG family transcriptional regulator n=1 Tax=Halorubrum lipolyticum DSM 21995 TaxID=1227482 RepID=M0NKN2_9EURY|nr:hypothetical protein [Halorubrum lipolyticum]EMA58386.1 hypothetical protein C469_13125 [Halorubrum lipolyticum DSM 21995]
MTDLTVSEDLADRIETRIQDTEFETVDEYAEFVLSEVVTRVEREADRSAESSTSREGVQERLESLGYLEE